jgi:Uncharacterised nucleotidyltransferase
MTDRAIIPGPEALPDRVWPASRPSRGQLLATALTTAWRVHPQPLAIAPKHFVEVLPLLLPPSGLSALAWWRLRHSDGPPVVLQALEDARGLVASQAFLHRRDLLRAVACLRTAGVEPILVKGWAIARLYPDPHMRSSSDLDLCVRRADYRTARRALHSAAVTVPIDLHLGFDTLDEEAEEVLFHRSRLVDCDGMPVRVLAPEDHLRVLCYHMLRHGASRPLWLCDVALAVEERPPDFDWARCLGPIPRVAGWVACAIGLAHCLLGARIDDTPLWAHTGRLPRWLAPTVLREWEKAHRVLTPLADHLRRPGRLLTEAPEHWPNGVQATVELRRPFNTWPRLPYQVAASLRGVARVIRGAIRSRRSSD